ncbi:conserved hypothetical protein [Talaromyces stipitatus ATCC 10500]|uniref:Transposase MuDR plant domain-containing protein n=1 Tax=Talaromyces stipitatus (strain ATCC 10500 / CBS 375.48 / QM 6759 / NRRL 1006) TaxID=441959 RepID=B8M1E7_TALSN|nr:uncharacterized protein TSTA_090830 [Talaromyces stipitatus ATCC 10500]EED21843.1 conserved hypothetical protein [Talaromyces stipitatus ATCC 10500]
MAEVVSGLVVGQRFDSLEDFKSAIRNISVRQHWDLRVMRSNKKSVVLGCRSSANCYFRVVCRANKNATCRRNLASPASTPARSEASHVRFLLNEIPKLFDMKTRIKGQDVVEAVKRYHGYDISMRQAQRALTKLQPRQSRGGHAQVVADHENHNIPHDQSSSSVRVNNETSFDPLTDDRGWPENGLSTTLMEDDSIDQDDSPTETASAAAMVRVQQSNPSLATMSHHHAQPGPSETRSLSVSTMSHHASQIAPLAPSGQGSYIQPIQLPVPPPSPPKTQSSPSIRHPHQSSHPHPQSRPQPPPPPPQHQQPTHTGHPVAAQLVLTNFKIEFTCTSCGALNQSFFPNQGNVTGGNYLPPAATHGIPPSAPPGPPPPSAATNGRLTTMDGVPTDATTNAAAAAGFGETDYQTSATSHGGRELPPWGGGLDVSLPPPNT